MPPEDDIPDWMEAEGEKIPPGLEKKWQDQEKKGLRAGVCKNCGWAFAQEDLTCKHCERPTEISEGVLISLKRFFLGTPLGIMCFIMIFMALVFFLFSSLAHAETPTISPCAEYKTHIEQQDQRIQALENEVQRLNDTLARIQDAAGDGGHYRPS